jgi:hypothetical protein
MSYDLTIKPDETYSRFTPRGPLEDFITKLPGVKRNGETGFVLDDRPRRWMEIDLEVVSVEGDLLEADGRGGADINCIRLHIPYKYLGDSMDRDYLTTASALSNHLGWMLYDEQTGQPVEGHAAPSGDFNKPPSKVFDRKQFAGKWVALPYAWSNDCMDYGIFEEGRFEMVMHHEDGSLCASAKGSWDLIGGAIQWTYGSCKGFARPRRPDLNEILYVDEKRFVIREPSGAKTEFWRAAPCQDVTRPLSLVELGPLLDRISGLLEGGFGSREIRRLMAMVEALEPDKSFCLVFGVRIQGLVSPLRVQVTAREPMSQAVVSFRGPVALAQMIEKEITRQDAPPN